MILTNDLYHLDYLVFIQGYKGTRRLGNEKAIFFFHYFATFSVDLDEIWHADRTCWLDETELD